MRVAFEVFVFFAYGVCYPKPTLNCNTLASIQLMNGMLMNSNVGLSAMKVKCFLAAAAALVLFSCEARTTGIILHGWDTLRQTPEEVLANADSFADTSADGVTLTIRRKPSDGRDLSSARLFNGVPWRHGDAEDIIPVFRDIVGKKNLGLSLLNVWIVPKKRLRWNDDAAWAVVETNFSVVARLAKMGQTFER